jgi:outer membrane receptor protein involved in Fe transport
MFPTARTRPASLVAVILVGGLATAHAEEPVPPQAAPSADAPAEPPPPAADPAPAPATPAATATIKGSLIDNNTKEPLPAATIQVKGLATGDITTVAELDGTYSIALPPGTYTIVFSTPEYIEHARTITVADSQTADLSVNLDPVPAVGTEETIEIVGTIDVRKESAVLAVRRAASTVSDAVSSQEIARTPDSNAGDAMKRVVAVTVTDGKYVALRGLEGRYVTALLNGVLLPSPEPDRNAVPLDLFPTSLLSTMTVMKSYSADLPGQFGGGTLSIDTSSFPTSFEMKVGLSTSANTLSTGQSGLSNANVHGFGSFAGFDSGDRALPAAVPRNRPVRGMTAGETEAIGEAMPNVWTPHGETVSPNLGLNVTVGDTRKLGGKRVGYLGSAMLRRGFTVRDGRTGRVALIDGQLAQTESLDYLVGTAEATVGALVNVGVDLTPNDEVSVLGLYTHVGEDVSSMANGYSETDGSEIDVSRTSFVERSLAFAQLHGKHHLSRARRVELRWQGNVATTSRHELDSRDLIYTVDSASGLRQYKDQPGSGQHFWQVLDDLSGGGGADLRMKVGRAQLRAGTMAQLSSRVLGGRRFRYKYVGSDPMVRGLAGEAMFDEQHIGPEFQLEESTLEEDAYNATLDTYAGFAMGEVELGDKLRAIGGVRYEHASQEMSNGTRFAVGGLERDIARTDDDVLPATNLVYSPRSDMNLRAAYSYTLTRPRFRELAPFLFFDYIRRRSISGNPELATTHIHNADLRWEWFPGEDEVFAISGFYKNFVDPIEQVLANAKTDATFLNAKGGNLVGVELEARTSLARITPALSRFKVGTNVAVMRSRVQLGADQMLLTHRNRPLYGQAPYVLNVNVGWAHPQVADINVLYNVVGPRITDVGIEGLPDTFDRPMHRVDVVAARAVSKDLKLKLSVGNLLNQRVRVEQDDVIVNSYAPGVSVSLGLDWTP